MQRALEAERRDHARRPPNRGAYPCGTPCSPNTGENNPPPKKIVQNEKLLEGQIVTTGMLKKTMIFSFLIALAFVPSLLIILDDHPAFDGAWRTVLLGPFAGLDRYAGEWTRTFWNVYAPVGACVGLIIPSIIRDSCLTRILFFFGVFLWFESGSGEAWVWK